MKRNLGLARKWWGWTRNHILQLEYDAHTLIHIPFSLRRWIPKAVSTNKINNEARLKLVYVTSIRSPLLTPSISWCDYTFSKTLPCYPFHSLSSISLDSFPFLPLLYNPPPHFLPPTKLQITMRWTITPSLCLTACDPSTPTPQIRAR